MYIFTTIKKTLLQFFLKSILDDDFLQSKSNIAVQALISQTKAHEGKNNSDSASSTQSKIPNNS